MKVPCLFHVFRFHVFLSKMWKLAAGAITPVFTFNSRMRSGLLWMGHGENHFFEAPFNGRRNNLTGKHEIMKDMKGSKSRSTGSGYSFAGGVLLAFTERRKTSILRHASYLDATGACVGPSLDRIALGADR
jgi:hypothetical protein